MSYYSNQFQLLAAATIAAATSTKGFNFGEYRSGVLLVHALTLAATTRVYAAWQVGIDATGPGTGRYTTVRNLATAIKAATGIAIMTLPDVMLGRWHRCNVTLGGTTPASKLRIVALLKGQQ